VPDLAIVIVNYKARGYLRECLRSVIANPLAACDIIVVDNDSRDGTPEMLGREFPGVRLLVSDRNIGYGPANNLGLRAVLAAPEGPPDYALLLNPDTVVPATALAEMMAFMQATPNAGACGPKLVREDGTLDLACKRGFPTPATALYHFLRLDQLLPESPRFGRYNMTFISPDTAAEVDSLVGAFMLLRRQALEQVGLFDEAFFMYGEDLDLCYRLKQGGWQVYYHPAVTVLHHKGASSRQNSAKANYEFYRAMLLFHRKHYAASTFFMLNWVITAAILLMGGLAQVRNRLRPGVGSA
jgi:N-acetylglucosaminyl-diphospho-decaprenol L-rhamnosyltransferase